jgi:hypothetical protein
VLDLYRNANNTQPKTQTSLAQLRADATDTMQERWFLFPENNERGFIVGEGVE